MAPRETENNAYAKFGVTNKEHYGMLWYFLEWSMEIVKIYPGKSLNEFQRSLRLEGMSEIQARKSVLY